MKKRRYSFGSTESQLYLHTVILLFLLPTVWFGAAALGERQSYIETLDHANANAGHYALTIDGLMKQHVLIPDVVAICPCIDELLDSPGDNGLIAKVGEHLFKIAEAVSADAISLLDSSGVVLASSEWKAAEPSQPRKYGHRSYFREALANGRSREITAGAAADELGFYVARRVGARGSDRRGVIVLRDRLDSISNYLARASRLTGSEVLALTDERNVVVASSAPTWVLRPLFRIPEGRRADYLGNYPQIVLHRIPILDGIDAPPEEINGALVDIFDPYQGRFRIFRESLNGLGLSVDIFSPIEPWKDRAIRFGVAAVVLVLVVYFSIVQFIRRGNRWSAAHRP